MNSSLYEVVSYKFKKYTSEFNKRGLNKINEFARLKQKDPIKYNEIINDVCDESDVFLFKRELEEHIKKETYEGIFIGLGAMVIIFVVIYAIGGGFSSNYEYRNEYSICECKDMYQRELLGYKTDFIQDCMNGPKHKTNVAKYASNRGWFPALGDQKLIDYSGNYFIYNCNN